MGSILGEVVVRHNGKQFKTTKGSQLNPGGYTRTPKVGPGRVWGQSKEYTVPTITMVIAADEDVDVLEINAIEFATLTWEGDNGVDYMMTDSAPQGPATLSDSGDINVVFQGNKVSKT
ncbi:phage tail tube protein [Aliivibrio sp. S4TY2]|uniref:phage tail tube protein n=1 Tax=unclassified Aliivibrio TaxID=2645654 RepID=UPI002378C3DC|nr:MULTISPECIES: phage tail tube protein [unclassified Aliivibrio]MDD9158309.1 phage tail tube protein [Aliivibrio sp. S4TY2]MDD9162279.1 phage tail tube protein [Aliivibrio sp. S4TY1]MDD9166317.1 phage tail tube protein [Aliivibrio sp. S4MY2]MDD9170315.1 phage tail tube protein [Aliivibrio sp. S4MY4]MDD9187366.1 phage tail tube protein [Aliivibrio sp. S4MY3]